MQIAIVGAGYPPKRPTSCAARWPRSGAWAPSVSSFATSSSAGMLARGYSPEIAERCFSQIEGFADYGFPESHAAAFALLVYVSAWLKCHHPAVFACALLNAQPMGFYAPAQIVRDAREHGVEVRPVCVNPATGTTAGTPPDGAAGAAAGVPPDQGLPRGGGRWIAAARGNGYPDPRSLAAGRVAPARWNGWPRRMPLPRMGLTRRDALWAAADPNPSGGRALAAVADGVAVPQPRLDPGGDRREPGDQPVHRDPDAGGSPRPGRGAGLDQPDPRRLHRAGPVGGGKVRPGRGDRRARRRLDP
jgi:error-prone DNA polymerase